MPHTLAQPLSSPDYKGFNTIGRCLHFHDFLTCWNRRALVPHPIKSTPQYVPSNIQVLWFAPSKKPTEHNFYGNVTFSISFAEVHARFGLKFYYVDQSQYNTHDVTRILLSRNNFNYKTVEYGELDAGSPMILKPPGRWKHAAGCKPASIYSARKLHELEIALHVTPEDCAWLFRKCTISVNNHSNANSRQPRSHSTYQPHICHRYNLFHRPCPYSLSNEVAVAVIRTWVGLLLRQENGLVDPAALFTKVLADTVGRFEGAGEDSLLQMMSGLRL